MLRTQDKQIQRHDEDSASPTDPVLLSEAVRALTRPPGTDSVAGICVS